MLQLRVKVRATKSTRRSACVHSCAKSLLNVDHEIGCRQNRARFHIGVQQPFVRYVFVAQLLQTIELRPRTEALKDDVKPSRVSSVNEFGKLPLNMDSCNTLTATCR